MSSDDPGPPSSRAVASWERPGLRELAGVVLSFAVGSAMVRHFGPFRSLLDYLWASSLAVMAGMIVLGPILLLVQKGRGRRGSLFAGEGLWLAQLVPLILIAFACGFPRGSPSTVFWFTSAILLAVVIALGGLIQFVVLALDPKIDRRWTSWVGCLVALWPAWWLVAAALIPAISVR